MNDHEKLKEIIDLIGFDILKINSRIEYTKLYGFHIDGGELYWKTYDIREIIFTQEFMNKFIAYRKNWKLEAYPLESLIGTFAKELLGGIEDRKGHLNNPIDYLYKILGLNTK